MPRVDVVVIGAGVTGAGVARDLALRGVSVALVDQGDVAQGTSGRNHGLLHSGGRYVVEDPSTAIECLRENTILRRIAAHCIDPCGGMFVGIEGDDPAYSQAFTEACAKAGIEATRIGPREARDREPGITEKVREAFLVPDAAVDPFLLCLANAVDAAEHGARILTHHALRAIAVDAGGVKGVLLEDLVDREQRELACRVVVNAAGPWAGEVAAMAGLDVTVFLSRGALLVTRDRLVRGVVNRLRLPSDGDIIVPGGPACLVGTTSVKVNSPRDLGHSAGEVARLIDLGSDLVPALRTARILREFAGIRPLYGGSAAGDGREASRGFVVLDHATRDGLDGFMTVVGGKLTTYRLMAEQTANLAASKLGVKASSTTAERMLPGSEPGGVAWPAAMPPWMTRSLELRHGSRAAAVADGDVAGESRLCLCECVTEAEIRFAMRRLFARTLDDLRRRTRMGMGPCQGSTCGPRAAALLANEFGLDPGAADRMLGEFLREREEGMLPVARRGGAAQEELNLSARRGLAGGGGVMP